MSNEHVTQRPLDPPEIGKEPARRAWTPPRLEELPRLTDLTLDSIPGSGETGGGGGTVF